MIEQASWYALCVIRLPGVANYSGYHAPSATVDVFELRCALNTQEFGSLFTIYSAPNIALVFLSGKFIDR